MTATRELTTDQVAQYLEATCALVESELEALGDDSGWHFDPRNAGGWRNDELSPTRFRHRFAGERAMFRDNYPRQPNATPPPGSPKL